MPSVVAEESSKTAPKKESKNQRRRRLEKERKQAASTTSSTAATPTPELETPTQSNKNDEKIETIGNGEITDDIADISPDDPLYAHFKELLEKFAEQGTEDVTVKEPEKPEVFYDDDDEIPDEDEETKGGMSKKKRKQQNKLSIAELKAIVKKPELVDWTDTDASDPRLLVAIKSYRNVVPVPTHWSLKREYLSSKRGVEKAPFALPKFIQDTGIAEMRDAVLEKQDQASLKQKARERVQPKMGKLDIDYQKLYEAFFRFQTKPELTRYGEIYYEGKEYETNLRHLRPGDLSEDLKEALNIPPGAPPPWLINQQRFGPPPSYPALKIPGLNAPPPPGSTWGFHPGGYGKPPVDENSRPLYGGDIFGVIQPQQNQQTGEPVERTLWGELQPQEESEEEEEEESEEEDDADNEDVDESGLQTGVRTTTGIESMAPSAYGGTESVQGDFTLRKQRRGGTDTEETPYPRSAGQVLPEQNVRSGGFFASERGYDLSATRNNLPVLGEEKKERKRKAGDIDVSVDVDALERDDKLSKTQVKKHYDTERQSQHQSQFGGAINPDDLSDMIAEESAKRRRQEEERRKR